jgi:hypothetical protein
MNFIVGWMIISDILTSCGQYALLHRDAAKTRAGSAELFCNCAAFVQILRLSSAGILTRSIRNGGCCCASRSAGNVYSWTLDHFHPFGRFTSPRRSGFQWIYPGLSWCCSGDVPIAESRR